MYDSIKIFYWRGVKLDNLNWENGTTYPYSVEKMDKIVSIILKLNYKLMMSLDFDNLYIYIDNHMFQQW